MNKNGAAPGREPRADAHRLNGRYATDKGNSSAIRAEAIPRIQAIITNAAASLLGDLDPETALLSTVRLGESVLCWIEVDLAERELAIAS